MQVSARLREFYFLVSVPETLLIQPAIAEG